MTTFIELPINFAMCSSEDLDEAKQHCELMGIAFNINDHFKREDGLVYINPDQIVCFNEAINGNTIVALTDGSANEYLIKFKDFIKNPLISIKKFN
jgi:hypothetical protein